MFARIASPAESAEDAFVARLRMGDSDAFETLYARTFPAAYGAALRVTGNAVDAQDVTQAAFMKAWYLREGLNFASPEGWMVRVARNIAIDVVRRRATRNRVLSEIPSDGTVELESEAMAELEAARVRAALPKLPATERRVIELRYLGSATEAQVAQITGTALGTVKTRTRSGLRRLRRILGE